VTLVFDMLDMEYGYDYVYVDQCSDASCSSSTRLASLTGSSLPAPLVSSTGFMRVRMATDYSVRREGFLATYAGSTRVYDCSWGEAGAIVSAQGMLRNVGGASCSWLIESSSSSPSAQVLFLNAAVSSEISFSSCSVADETFPPSTTPPPPSPPPDSATCSSYLPVPGSPFTGQSLPAPFTASSPIKLLFSSDASINYQGFLARWGPQPSYNSAACSSSSAVALQADFGGLSDGVGLYSNSASCSWILAPAGASSVTLVFDMLDMEYGYDYVYVDQCSDASCSSSTRLASLTGSSLPAPLVSSTGFMRVRMATDYSVRREGFLATYAGSTRVYDCSWGGAGAIVSAQGMVTDGAGAYASLSSCSWTIAPAGSSSVSLTFYQFDVETNWDTLAIEECSSGRRRIQKPSLSSAAISRQAALEEAEGKERASSWSDLAESVIDVVGEMAKEVRAAFAAKH